MARSFRFRGWLLIIDENSDQPAIGKLGLKAELTTRKHEYTIRKKGSNKDHVIGALND